MKTEKTISSISHKDIFLLFLSFAALFFGGILYLNFRPHTLYMFSWLRFLGIENFFVQKNFNQNSAFLSFCVYSLPNGLWALSALIIFGLVWKNSESHFLFYALSFTAINVLFEILQFFSIVSGTFDFTDILVIVISFFMGVFIYKFFLKGGSYEF